MAYRHHELNPPEERRTERISERDRVLKDAVDRLFGGPTENEYALGEIERFIKIRDATTAWDIATRYDLDARDVKAAAINGIMDLVATRKIDSAVSTASKFRITVEEIKPALIERMEFMIGIGKIDCAIEAADALGLSKGDIETLRPMIVAEIGNLIVYGSLDQAISGAKAARVEAEELRPFLKAGMERCIDEMQFEKAIKMATSFYFRREDVESFRSGVIKEIERLILKPDIPLAQRARDAFYFSDDEVRGIAIDGVKSLIEREMLGPAAYAANAFSLGDGDTAPFRAEIIRLIEKNSKIGFVMISENAVRAFHIADEELGHIGLTQLKRQ